MPTLPTRPSIEHLKKQAKRLLKAAQNQSPEALAQIGPYFGDPARISLQQAQLVIARDHGFSSWTRLKRHIEAGAGTEETTEQRANRFLDLACVHYALDPNRGPAEFEQAAALLAAHPEIAAHSLHCAAAAGNTDEVARHLANPKQQVDEKGGPFQWTPLMYAAYARVPGASTYPAGRALLQAGADPNAHYMSFGTYRFAVLTGIFGDGEGGLTRQPPHPEMEPFARAVLDAGANPNDSQGAYNRCFSPDNTHLKLMLEYGLQDSDPSDWWLTEPNRKPEEHRTMHFQLIIALRWGFADRARLLIDHGVDINTPDNNYTYFRMPLSDDTKEEYTEVFNLFDKEEKGKIDSKEIASIVRALGLNPSEAQVAELIKKADPSGSGSIGVDAVFNVMEGHGIENDSEEVILESFKIFDNKGKGKIAATELTAICRNMGEPFTDEEAEQMMAMMDIDDSGDVDYADWLKTMLAA